MAVESIRSDVGDIKAAADAFVQDIRDAKDSIVEFAHDPLNSAMQKLLIPAAASVISGLRAKKDEAPASDGAEASAGPEHLTPPAPLLANTRRNSRKHVVDAKPQGCKLGTTDPPAPYTPRSGSPAGSPISFGC
jgi:hypothetical protein